MMQAGKTVSRCLGLLVAGLMAVLTDTPASAQIGPLLSGTGAINRSMGGAATGSSLSAGGALMWNPASLSALDQSELEIGAELLFPHTQLTSAVPGLTGSTGNEDAVYPLPTIALSYRPQQSNFTYGLGLFAVAGFGLNYAGSTVPGNPLLLPPPNGLGPIFSQYQVVQVTPALVYDMTDRLSISVSPLLNIGMAQLDPAVFADPLSPPAPPAIGPYPSGTHSSSVWGGGYSVGAYYRGNVWDFGASYKSKQWFESYEFNSFDTVNNVPITLGLDLDLPSIISLGTSYKGFERWLFAADVRYVDFTNTGALGNSGYTPAGALRGVGMENVFAISFGAQYRLTNALTLRGGYSWNENPIPNSQSSANVASPLIIQNTITAGATYQVTDAFNISLAYMHGFENSISGPIVHPIAGPLPGTTVTNTASVDSIIFGAVVKFGCPRCRIAVPPQQSCQAPPPSHPL